MKSNVKNGTHSGGGRLIKRPEKRALSNFLPTLSTVHRSANQPQQLQSVVPGRTILNIGRGTRRRATAACSSSSSFSPPSPRPPSRPSISRSPPYLLPSQQQPYLCGGGRVGCGVRTEAGDEEAVRGSRDPEASRRAESSLTCKSAFRVGLSCQKGNKH